MKKLLLAVAAISTPFLFSSCFTNPVTGRSSLNFVDEGTMQSMATSQYSSFIDSVKPVTTGAQAAMVKKVGTRMAQAVAQYLNSKGQGDIIKDYQWEFNLVNSNEANAWCMPGGKVVVYSGILPYTQSETGLAVVMGHEIAHAIARHGNERMSQEMTAQMGGVALSAALANKPQQTQTIFNTAFGIGSQVGVLLPFSRKHESEADHMGLIFMAMAGYNPREAATFWERMSSNAGSKPPVLLSTHPSDQQRISQINNWLPEALTYYKG